MVMFAGSYFCILLTQFTLAVVQISAVGVKKTKQKQFAMFLIPLKSNTRPYQSKKALFMYLAP